MNCDLSDPFEVANNSSVKGKSLNFLATIAPNPARSELFKNSLLIIGVLLLFLSSLLKDKMLTFKTQVKK